MIHIVKIVLNEPSVIVFDKKTKVISVGYDANEMLGKNPDSYEVIRPLKDGAIIGLNA